MRHPGVVVAAVVACLLTSSHAESRSRPRSRALARPRAVTPSTIRTWPRPEVLELALRAYRCGDAAGQFDRPVLALIDYSLPSTQRRLWVIDVVTERILFHELVAHGVGSGENFAVEFSNLPRSRQSSVGLFRTEDVYRGRHGYSLRLTGLEPGINDRAMERAIVMHAADYVSPRVAAVHGQLGRSWGCPALERRVHRAVIDKVRGGGALFVYYPDAHWLRDSAFLRCETRSATR
jgi:hypothetical protein